MGRRVRGLEVVYSIKLTDFDNPGPFGRSSTGFLVVSLIGEGRLFSNAPSVLFLSNAIPLTGLLSNGIVCLRSNWQSEVPYVPLR
jgi:hypothetical protein